MAVEQIDSLRDVVWQFKEALAALRLCRRFGVIELAQHIDVALPAMESAVETLDAFVATRRVEVSSDSG